MSYLEKPLDFETYQACAKATAVYPDDARIIYPALGLCGEAGEVAELVKKALRDEGGEFSEERRVKLQMEISDCLWYCAQLATDLGLSLEGIAAANLQKLRSRQERGVLGGSGDDR